MGPLDRRRYGPLGLSLALALAACGAENEDGLDTVPDRTTLEAVIPVEPPHLVPYTGQHGGGFPVFDSMLMRLLGADSEGELFSYAFESWEVAEDGRTVVFAVRPGIEWSDGTPMTSADVVMSLTQYLDPNLTTWSGSFSSNVVGQPAFAAGETESISGLSAPDDYTVLVELEEPTGTTWLLDLSETKVGVVLPAHVLGDIPHAELSDHEYFQSFPVTNGPYRFVEWVSGQHIELERNDNWSPGEAGFERAFFKFVTPDAQVAQLETRESQFIQITPDDADRVSSFGDIEIESRPALSSHLWLLRHYEPLLDKRVRQAMMYAIDREGICEAVYGGYCTVPLTNTGAPSWAIHPDATEYRYDPDRARELLDDANWDSSTELIFLNWATPDSLEARAITIAQDNMAKVGINWTIEDVDVPALNERVEEVPGSFHGALDSSLPEALDPGFVRPQHSCELQYPDGINRSHYCNEELDKLLDEGRVEADNERRAAIYKDALRILNEEIAEIYLLTPEDIFAYDSHLKGVNVRPGWWDSYWNIGEWHWVS